jgi:N-acylneuraminate cytidylyltransferase
MEILVIIPARGGSKGLPRKNIRPLLNKPLIAHTIEQALHAQTVTRVVVSTDDDEIATVSTAYGAEVVTRPDAISGDEATSESALCHVLEQLAETEEYSPDVVVFLQCTSPLRAPNDIDLAVQELLTQEADSLLSVVPFHLFTWRLIDGKPEAIDYDYQNRPRRQDRYPEFIENGSIYVFKPWVLKQFNNRLGGKIALYVMDPNSLVDINDERDFALCELLMERHQLETI